MEPPLLLLLTTLLLLGGPTLVLGQNITFCIDHADGSFCMNCMEGVYCSGGASSNPISCEPQSTVCQEYPDGVAACVPVSDTTDCKCSSNICDFYDPDSLDFCNSSGIYDVLECPNCRNGECGVTTSPPVIQTCNDSTAVIGGWNPITPECSNAFYCNSDYISVAEVECNTGQYVDANGNCQTAPPQPCSGCSSDVCPDYTDCTQFYTCEQGSPAGNVIACPTGTFFDASATAPPFCADNETVCDPLTRCDWGSSTFGPSTPLAG